MKSFIIGLCIIITVSNCGPKPGANKSEPADSAAVKTLAPLGVTSITHIDNHTDFEIIVWKLEQDKDNPIVSIPAHGSKDVDIWIPWAENREEYNNKKIIIREGQSASNPNSEGVNVYYVWQRNVNNDDRIRSSKRNWVSQPGDDGWEDPGSPIDGASYVNGNRNLTVDPGRISVIEPGK